MGPSFLVPPANVGNSPQSPWVSTSGFCYHPGPQGGARPLFSLTTHRRPGAYVPLLEIPSVALSHFSFHGWAVELSRSATSRGLLQRTDERSNQRYRVIRPRSVFLVAVIPRVSGLARPRPLLASASISFSRVSSSAVSSPSRQPGLHFWNQTCSFWTSLCFVLTRPF